MMAALQEFFHFNFPSFHLIEEAFLAWDKTMFKHINQDWTNPLFDLFMPFITDYHNTWLFVIVIVAFIIVKAKMKAAVILLGCVLAVGLADSFAAKIVKPAVHRTRPSFTEPNARLLVPPQSSPSFPSNHAANCFAAATFMGLYILGTGPIMLFFAAVVGYSRIYVGVHFPLDVIGGAFIGFLSGMIIFKIFLVVNDFINPKPLRALPKKWKKKNYLGRK